MAKPFNHQQTAHCENGVVSGLLNHAGLTINEPLCFGLGSGLFYIYIPFLKINNGPAISYRSMPHSIFKDLKSLLNIKFIQKKFKNQQVAQQELDQLLAQGKIVGLQVGVYNLPYFPESYRFHFNGHNLIVYGTHNGKYLISDPVMEYTTELSPQELNTVRFAEGVFAPKGHLFYVDSIPQDIDYKIAIKKAIDKNCRRMLIRLPVIGVNGIRYVSKKILKWQNTLSVSKLNYYLAQMIRMQEEIGTGGGGFRFIYAAFLEQASEILSYPPLKEEATRMATIAEKWRHFAVEASRLIKNRNNPNASYQHLAISLSEIAEDEKHFFLNLKNIMKSCP